MSEQIQELEAKLAEARKAEQEETGFTIVIFDDNGEDLTKVKVKPSNLTENDKFEITASAVDIVENREKIEVLQSKMNDDDFTYGDMFRLRGMIENPVKSILGTYFKFDKEKIEPIWNFKTAMEIINDSDFITEKVKQMTKSMNYTEVNK